MTLKQRIEGFVQLGLFINRHFSGQLQPNETAVHQGLDKVIEVAHTYNNWFIPNFVKESIQNIASFLDKKELETFTQGLTEPKSKTVAVICAGNIPLVCFHDILCVLLSGHKVLIKMSSDDSVLLPFFLKLLCHYEPQFENRIFFSDGKLSNFQAVIATGSDNTASHLNYYFSKYPNIIRKSRSSLAILNGSETKQDLANLGKDIFTYFGLGCRNVSKLLVPKDYNFDLFFESIIDFGFVIHNKKYGNNYDYHRAIYLLESMKFLDNNFVMLKQSADLHSPVGVVYYQTYTNTQEVENYLFENKTHLQCVIGSNYIPFGYSQKPVISDFADNFNTLEFLLTL